MRSQIMSQLFRNTTVPPRPGRVTDPARAGLKAAPVSTPHEDAEDQGQADRDRREVGGATAVLANLARIGWGPGTLGLEDRLARYKEATMKEFVLKGLRKMRDQPRLRLVSRSDDLEP
jgi:hypothetical protein